MIDSIINDQPFTVSAYIDNNIFLVKIQSTAQANIACFLVVDREHFPVTIDLNILDILLVYIVFQ